MIQQLSDTSTCCGAGKRAGLNAVSNSRGVVAALALDQRGILKKEIARQKGMADVPDSTVVEFKELVTESLTKYVSAILLDPEFGLSATKLRNRKGLFLAYERSCYDAAPPRMPALYESWSVRRLKEAGADCVKVLLHYTPFDRPQINEQKKIWVHRIGDECRANDVPFVLEILGYGGSPEEEKTVVYARRKPQMVALSVEEFSKDDYSVDLLKIEVPAQMKFIPATRSFSGEGGAYSREEAQQSFRNIDSVTSKPYVYLSAGVSTEEFVETLEFAIESGSRFNGVLCGRATWQEGIPIFAQKGAEALLEWLNTHGVQKVSRINKVLERARPWYEKLQVPIPGEAEPLN